MSVEPNEFFRREAWMVLLFVLMRVQSLGATEIPGKVAAVTGDSVEIAIDGDLLPAAGDKVEIFFKLGEAEVSVGSGTVMEATAASIKTKIEKATGTVSRDQFARIDSRNPTKRPAAVAATSASTLPTAFLGVVMSLDDGGVGPGGVQVVQIVPDSPAAVAGFSIGDLIVAVDGSLVTKPQDATFKVSSSIILSQPVTVGYAMRGTARQGPDYTLGGISGQVTIAAGQNSATVVLHAVADHVKEKSETAIMAVSSSTRYKLSTQSKATLTILNAP